MKDNWILLGVFAAMLTAYGLMFHWPQHRRLAAADTAMAETKAQLADDALLHERARALAEQIEEMRGLFRGPERRLATQDELPDVLRELANSCDAAALETQAFEPSVPVRASTYYRLPVTVRASGSFAALSDFIGRMERMERMTSIERLQVRPTTPDGAELSVDLRVNIYYGDRSDG